MKLFIAISFILIFLSSADAQVYRPMNGHSVNGMDANTQAFINATGITDSTIKVAINTLVIAAKAHGWWDLCKVIYPFVGGSATTHKYNLKDPRDLDAAFRLTFYGGWTHNNTGALPNGSTGYADTHLIPSDILLLNSVHWSFYSRTNVAGGYDLGSINSADQLLLVDIKINTEDNNASAMYSDNSGAIHRSYDATDTRGYFMGSRTAANNHTFYQNANVLGQNTANQDITVALPTETVYISNANAGGPIPSQYGKRELAFFSLGAGISSTLASTMYTDIQNFQIALGRQM